MEIAIQVGIFVALALGLNIVVGLAGLLDLGYVAFFAVGAYSWAIFGSPQANQMFGGSAFPLSPWWFFVFLLVGVGVAAGAGILLGLPVLRLHGDYLALVTLGFGEVIRVLANNLDKPINVTNGPKGITPIGRPPIFFAPLLQAVGIDPSSNVIYPLYFSALVLLIVGVTVLVNRRLEDSHIGRAWEAIREDQTAAQAMGVPLVRMKLLAFACGASFAGAVGVLFSAKQIFINPESFTFMESIGVLAMIILGGMGSIPGAILGATVLTALNAVDFELEEGRIASIIGPNGAGKTTFFNVFTGLYVPEEGSVTFRATSLLGLRPDQITALGVCRTFQNIRLFKNMTAVENVLVGMHSRVDSSFWGALSRNPPWKREEGALWTRAAELLDI